MALHKPKGILFHWYNTNSQANAVFSLSFFRRGTCQKAEPKSSVVKNVASPSFQRLSSICDIFYCYCVQVSFLLDYDNHTRPRRLRGFSHVVFKQHFYFRSSRLRFLSCHAPCSFPMGNGILF